MERLVLEQGIVQKVPPIPACEVYLHPGSLNAPIRLGLPAPFLM